MPPSKGTKQRNFPSLTLEEALEVPRAIQDKASGMSVSRLALAELLDRSPNASQFRELLLASRAYGLTEGGVNADQFELTALGDQATGADEVDRQAALRKAVLNIEPYRTFLTSYDGKKVPSATPFKEFLTANAAVPRERTDECMEHLLTDARTAGLLRQLKSGLYVEFDGSSAALVASGDELQGYEVEEDAVTSNGADGFSTSAPRERANRQDDSTKDSASAPKKVFIAHGKNRAPLDQLKDMLNQFKVKYAVAVDEPHVGRPISAKVANLMRDECSSAIFIFTADERFLREDTEGNTIEGWHPSENVVYELGAASVLYDRRIVIFKEKRVTFPSDFSDLGYIEFESDQLVVQMGNLFKELVALDILYQPRLRTA